YIARTSGDIDWLQIVHPLDASHGYEEFFASCDSLVVGRGTYDTVLGFADYPYAGKRLFVMTHRPAESRHGTTFVAGTVSDVNAPCDDRRLKPTGCCDVRSGAFGSTTPGALRPT